MTFPVRAQIHIFTKKRYLAAYIETGAVINLMYPWSLAHNDGQGAWNQGIFAT